MVGVVAKPNLVSCNFPTLKNKYSIQPHTSTKTTTAFVSRCCFIRLSSSCKVMTKKPFAASFRKKGSIVICHDSNKESEVSRSVVEVVEEGKRDWTTSILLFLLWAALIYYVSFLSPNQTPVIIILFLFQTNITSFNILMFIAYYSVYGHVFLGKAVEFERR